MNDYVTCTLLPPDAILGSKCTQNAFAAGAEPAGGAYSAPPDPLAVFEGAASRQGRGMEGKGREGEGKGRGGEEIDFVVAMGDRRQGRHSQRGNAAGEEGVALA